MSRDPDTILREIDAARDRLADSLDALSERANPRHLVEDGRQRMQETLGTPMVRYVVIGVAAILVLSVLRNLFR